MAKLTKYGFQTGNWESDSARTEQRRFQACQRRPEFTAAANTEAERLGPGDEKGRHHSEQSNPQASLIHLFCSSATFNTKLSLLLNPHWISVLFCQFLCSLLPSQNKYFPGAVLTISLLSSRQKLKLPHFDKYTIYWHLDASLCRGTAQCYYRKLASLTFPEYLLCITPSYSSFHREPQNL